MYILLTSPIETAEQAGSAITDERKSDSSQRHQAGRTSDIDDSLYQEHRTDPRTDQLGKRIFNFDRILKNAIDHIENSTKTNATPTKPSSFPTMDKMKSVCGSGR